MSRQATTRSETRRPKPPSGRAPRTDIDLKSMSSIQLIQSVYQGLRIKFNVFDGDPVSGYLAGIDQHYFKVLVPDGDDFILKLVNRSTNPTMDFASRSTYENEPAYRRMEEIVAPFRNAMRNASRRTTPGGAGS